MLLATIDLGPVSNNSTETFPYGVQLIGKTGSGSGYTVTDVGDVAKTVGGGYDDFVIGAPGLTAPSLDGNPTFTGTSTAYLVFGSDEVNQAAAVEYQTLSNVPLTQGNQRAGDLGQLGQLSELTLPPYQVNPTVTQPTPNPPNLPFVGYNYNGLTFTTSGTANSGLGFSVAALGDIDNSGFNSFAIGAPNAAGGGKVYLIYGSAALAALAQAPTAANKVIDLDGPALKNAGVKEIILTDSTTGGGAQGNQLGYSVGGLGHYFNFGPTAPMDITFGAPGAMGDAGAVYALSGVALEGITSGTTVDLSTLTTTLNTLGIKYIGNTGDRAGSSVGTALDFDHYFTPTTNFEVDDLLIGAPGNERSYIVYGFQQLANTNNITDSHLGTIQQLSQIGSALPFPVGNNLNYPLEGVLFNNPGLGSTLFGFSVSSAGDYNGDGTDDVIIGAPGNTVGNLPSASIFYGVPQFTAVPTSVTNRTIHLTGIYTPNQTAGVVPQVPPPLVYQDQSGQESETGFSVSFVGDIPGQGINGVLIGAPMTSGGLGQAYVIPGNFSTPTIPDTATFPSVVPLTTAITSPVYAGFALRSSQSFATSPNQPFFGTSVSGRSPLIPASAQAFTVDGDKIPDVFVGAPGFNLANPATNNTTLERQQAGIVYVLEGSLLPQTAPNNVILTAAGIGTNTPTGPFTISATGALTIFIFSAPAGANGSPAFDPAADITSPATITVNGVTFTNVVVTPAPTTADPNEVRFTLTTAQVALLNLTVSTTPITFTVQGKTNATPPVTWIARALNDVIVGAGGGGAAGGGSAAGGAAVAPVLLTPTIFTGDLQGLPFPAVSTLSHLISYQPLPVQLAYEQYLPAPGFLAREELAEHPSKKGGAHQAPAGTVLNVGPIARSENKYDKHFTLSPKIFFRGKFRIGKATTFTHKVKVIPASEQTETFPG